MAIVTVAGACSGESAPFVSTDGIGVTTTEAEAVTEVEPEPLDEPADDTGVDDEVATIEDAGEVAPPLIRVDQFGYRPEDPKVAVIADPEVGFDAAVDHEPGPILEVHSLDDGSVVFEAAPVPWASGAVDPQSGDRGWWFDFSTVEEPGRYEVVDPSTDTRSDPFVVADDVYDDVLDAALKAFWFNRGNVAHDEAFAGPWADGAAFVGPRQDTDARSIDSPDDAASSRDVSGGWFDAGDTNKYVTFAMEPVHSLLTAWERHPDVFDDAVGIPESGNGIPDVLDEVRWEIDWLTRMQLDDGSVLTKVGVTGRDGEHPPSRFGAPRFYEEACSSSTIAAAGMFAHAAIVFAEVPGLDDRAADLRERAVAAFDWYEANERRDDCDPQIIRAGDADLSLEEQQRVAVVAAVYLAELDGDRRYHDLIADELDTTLPFVDEGFGRYGPDQGDALLRYRDVAGARASVVQRIDRRVAELIGSSTTYGFDPDAGLYRLFMLDEQYHWGSNMVVANTGATNLVTPGVPDGLVRALAHLHYLHGVNPLASVYVSNMDALGAERSMEVLFHYWFGERTAYDVGAGSTIGVPPGYIVGGPNVWYSGPTSPPAGQPPQKSYRDWSPYGSEPTWEISEPAIYYQAAYVRLLVEVIGS